MSAKSSMKSSAKSNEGTKAPAKGNHRVVAIAIVVVAVAVVLTLFSAFVWPGWGTAPASSGDAPTSDAVAKPAVKPSIEAKALPDDASSLVKALPESVLTYARMDVTASQDWASAKPIEEYQVVYSTGDTAKDVTVTLAQWEDSDAATEQYDALSKEMAGKELLAGNVKVSGKKTGEYRIASSSTDDTQSIGLWRNDTVVFQATGAKDSVQEVVKNFTL